MAAGVVPSGSAANDRGELVNDRLSFPSVGDPGHFHEHNPGDPWLHEYYEQFRPRAFGDDDKLKIVIILGSADISGGSYVIFQHAMYCKRHGADVTIATMVPHRAVANHWHPALDELAFCSVDDLGDRVFDLAIATWWRTVFELPKVRARHVLYFVQSEEARFYAVGDDTYASPLAELTYRFDLPIVTITQWLQAFLAFEHGRPSFLVRNGVDKQRYRPFGPVVQPRTPGKLRVLVEGPIDVAMKNVPDSVVLAREAEVDEIWLLTSSSVKEYAGADRVLSRVPIEQTGAVYRSCDVLLKLSRVEGMYGPPLEMFHCGGTVVTYDVTGHEEYVEHNVNGLVVPMENREGVIAALRQLKDDPSLLARLKHGAAETAARWPDWELPSREFWAIIRTLCRRPPADKLTTMLAIRGSGVS
jgi:O-antigen biosynthesis protein